MDSFTLFTANAWRKNDAEVIEYGGKIWINQGYLQGELGIATIADRTQYSDEFKKMRCEIQARGKYQPCRMFIEKTLAVEITMSTVKTQAAIFKNKFGVNQRNKVLRKQQSLGLRLKKLFPNENIIEEYFALHYRTDFTLEKHMLVVEIDQKGDIDRDPNYEKKRQKELEKLGYYLIRINPDKFVFDDYEELGRVSAYIAESIKKQTKKQTKRSLICDFSKRLLELEFKPNHSIKSKCLKWIVKNILPNDEKMKNAQSKIKPIKTGKELGKTYCLGCKDFTHNFRH